MFEKKEYFYICIMLAVVIVMVIAGCDIYEDEDGDWENGVVIKISNTSNCLIDFKIDGNSYDSLNPGEDMEEDQLGRGIHLLEAYPWNDEQFSCAFVFTPDLASDETYEWTIDNDTGCGSCDPTPTSPPATPTPSPTPSSTPST
ncbi:hypothetical protein K8T06_07590 [bacterium]|nr:hypothetical protein [bacterium]